MGSSAQALIVCSCVLNDGRYVTFVIAQKGDTVEERVQHVEQGSTWPILNTLAQLFLSVCQ